LRDGSQAVHRRLTRLQVLEQAHAHGECATLVSGCSRESTGQGGVVVRRRFLFDLHTHTLVEKNFVLVLVVTGHLCPRVARFGWVAAKAAVMDFAFDLKTVRFWGRSWLLGADGRCEAKGSTGKEERFEHVESWVSVELVHFKEFVIFIFNFIGVLKSSSTSKNDSYKAYLDDLRSFLVKAKKHLAVAMV
jgi:hypothetical protein